MPLDEPTQRLALLLQRELRRVDDHANGRVERGEVVTTDTHGRIATWESRRGDVIGRWYTEHLATYDHHDRILRWAWAGRVSQAMPSHADVIAREGGARGALQLAMSVVGDLGEAEATELAKLGLVVARGEALQIERTDTELRYIGLFDRPRPRSPQDPSHYSVPPPAVASPSPSRSAPPRAPEIREPSRPLFVPVATAMLGVLTRQAAGFHQGLFVIALDVARRPSLSLVALDAGGILRALDPPADLVEATQRMVEADQRDGNGPWRKLTARVLPKTDGGATLHVDVV